MDKESYKHLVGGYMLGKLVDGIASMVWTIAHGNEKEKVKANEDFQKGISENLWRNSEVDVLNAFGAYTSNVMVKAAKLKELKNKARDANEQWDKLSSEHGTAAQLQAVFGSPRALHSDGTIDIEHMFIALKKAYIDMMDVVAHVIDYAANNHAIMQALGIEMCFVLAHERSCATDIANVDGSTFVMLGTDEFRRTAIRLLEDECDDEQEQEADEC